MKNIMTKNDLNTIELLSCLSELGVALRAEGDRLHINAPKGVLDASLREVLSQRKLEIIRFLRTAASENNHETLPLHKAPREGSICTSFSQERLWFLSQLEPESIAYNITVGVKLPRQLQIDIFKKSLNEIFRRHEVLRTTFGEEEGRPVQIVSPAAPFDVQLENLQDVPQAQIPERVQQIATHQTLRPFNLTKDQLFRATLIQLGKEESFLIITMHHIITDRWSLGILAREIRSLYRAYSEDSPSPLPELPIQYADFAYSQRKWLEGDVLESQLNYWKQKLAGVQLLQLPADRTRPAIQTYRGGKKGLRLSKDLTEELNQLSQSHGVTLFMTLLAAFKVLLCRYTGQTDFAVGSPIANRNRTEVEGLIGFFVNTLVLRTDLSGNPHFLDLLANVKETVLGALSNQDTPFEKLVEAINPKRDMSNSPLFQVMFTFQNVPGTSVDLLGWSFFDTGTSMFDLTLYMWEEEKGLAGEIEYNVDLFDTVTIDLMTEHFETVLKGIVTNPEKRLSELPILTDSEKHRLLIEWNNTNTDYPKEKCFKQLFEEQVTRTPEGTAVICAGRSLTYYELNNRANQVANHLRKLDVRPDSIVGIYIDRSIDMVVGLLGILKAGGTYMPLDPYFPVERIKFMLEDSHSGILVTQSHLWGNLGEFSGKVICLDSDWGRISEEKESDPPDQAGPNDLAYTIYTSGSTGKPKGVQISHRALVNFLCSMGKKPGLTRGDTLLSVTTMSFDIFGLELFLPLITGAKVVITERGDALDGVRLIELLKNHEASIMQATPATWRLLIESGWSGSKNLRALCGGESLPSDIVGPLLDRCKELWNLYGPTETTIWSTIYRVRSKEDPILIGSPIANTQVYILDGSLQPVPAGVVGELHIGGEGLARGYLNRDALTREKFIPNPFGPVPGGHIYKTGDLARYRSDGRIECLGRSDHQVKVRGYRIELGEIETALADHPAVDKSVVVAREDQTGGKRLVAYIVPEKDATISSSEIRTHLKRTLPDYMIPSVFVPIDEFPLTPNGKINRLALPVPEGGKLEDSRAYVAPCTPLEETIAEIWKEVLAVDNISVHDNFFEIGGHSLLSMQVISRLEKKIGLKINPRELIYQTLGQLAASLEGQIRDYTTKVKKNSLWQAVKSRLFWLHKE